MRQFIKHIRIIDCILILFAFSFSFWLMFKTFSYQNGSILIATKAWSDFASHIPLIRSFSFGSNFPPQYPIFPGEPIRYHFLFFALVGFLERLGVRIDYAFNIPSAVGFTGLIIAIYYFSVLLFKKRLVGTLSVLFFLFNGSFSFLEFFKIHPVSQAIFHDIVTNAIFPSFGPYDNKIVSAFWNLNIYTNQRHLAGAYAVSLLLILYFLKVEKKRTHRLLIFILIGVILGSSFFFHQAVFLMTEVILGGMFLLFPTIRLPIIITVLISGLIALPQYLWLSSSHTTFKPLISFGYLVKNSLTIVSFLYYWLLNMGLHSILIPIGFILAPKNAKKILIVFLLLFIIGNSIQFSIEIAANHKFFNYFMIIGVMFSAYVVSLLLQKNLLFKCLAILTSFFLILSGIIDFFPVYNDTTMTVADYPINSDVSWIITNTKPTDIFLNNTYLYDFASLAGRKIFLGWPYFSWSNGYDTNTRNETMKEILQGTDKRTVCTLLLIHHIDYVEIDPLENTNFDFPNPPTLFSKQQFFLVHTNTTKNYSIYSVAKSC